MTAHLTDSYHNTLKHVLDGIQHHLTAKEGNIRISGISIDSRKITSGNIFVAVSGNNVDGHMFIEKAIKAGCKAILADRGKVPRGVRKKTVVVEVENTRAVLGHIASNFYNHPARLMKMIGITGTNGKTTVSYLIESIIRAGGGNPGVIGTVSYRYSGRSGKNIEMPADFTTPEAPDLHKLLKKMSDNGVSHVVMEVSSHALAQQRIEGLKFDVALFTNLSRDHLDFHKDMNRYYDSKKKLFCEYLHPNGQAIVVIDKNKAQHKGPDSIQDNSTNWGHKMAAEVEHELCSQSNKISVMTCCLDKDCSIHPSKYSFTLAGTSAEIVNPKGSFQIYSELTGEFNLRNILAATGATASLGYKNTEIFKGISAVKNIPGRLEKIRSSNQATFFVDYAHTPDAMENVLQTLKQLQSGRLICVFGCGGDRDPGKRPMMGKIAGDYCDVVLATSDNPRTESPIKILNEIEIGLKRSHLGRNRAEIILTENKRQGYDIIQSRREAIAVAVRYSRSGDIVLISGKGHESYQITITGVKYFDDREEVRKQMGVIQW